MFRFGAKARLIKKLRQNSDDLYSRLHDVFIDDMRSQQKINKAISDIDNLIQYIDDSTDADIEAKIILALKR